MISDRLCCGVLERLPDYSFECICEDIPRAIKLGFSRLRKVTLSMCMGRSDVFGIWVGQQGRDKTCGYLIEKSSPRAQSFEHLVPSYWCCLERYEKVRPRWRTHVAGKRFYFQFVLCFLLAVKHVISQLPNPATVVMTLLPNEEPILLEPQLKIISLH